MYERMNPSEQKVWKLAEKLRYRAGESVEQGIGKYLARTGHEAPELRGEPFAGRWYRLTLPEGMSGDGSPYHIYLKKGDPEKLVVFLSGGGMAWDERSASYPVSGGLIAAGEPHFYWNNLRPFTQVMNINIGITETGRKGRNPFAGWSFVVITYATGDLHIGNASMTYRTPDEERHTLHFHGMSNFRAAMESAVRYFPSPSKLLLAGDSAGGFAVPALARIVAADHYPDCGDITLLSDGALLEFDDFPHIISDIWQADPSIAGAVTGNNPVLDWYRALIKDGDPRFRYLYSCSTHDYLLSSFWNDHLNNRFDTDPEIQQLFFRRLRAHIKALHEEEPSFHFFIYDWKFPIYGKGGTVHTAVREPWFYKKTEKGPSMADWLIDAVNDRPYNVGISLLKSII